MPYTSFVSSGSSISYPIPGYDTAVEILRPGCTFGASGVFTDSDGSTGYVALSTAFEWLPNDPEDEDIRKNFTVPTVGIGSTWAGNPPTAAEIKTEIAREQAIYDYYQYERDRAVSYPDIGLQLDQLYHDIESGKLGVAATTGSWYIGISSIKVALAKSTGDPPT